MDLFFIVLGMCIVTYIPRLLPVFIIDYFVLPKWIKRWLNCIPYAALGALIFPSILTVEKDIPLIGLIGGIVAVIIASYRLHIIYVIGGSILTVILIKTLII
jgi:branched-subunit amino acid transport protein